MIGVSRKPNDSTRWGNVDSMGSAATVMRKRMMKMEDKRIDGLVKKWTAVPPPENNDDALPYPTHEGVIEVAGKTLHVFVLNDGMRVIDEQSLIDFFS